MEAHLSYVKCSEKVIAGCKTTQIQRGGLCDHCRIPAPGAQVQAEHRHPLVCALTTSSSPYPTSEFPIYRVLKQLTRAQCTGSGICTFPRTLLG